ncbi:hypothetical protein CSC34_3600 [Pseudomonas aeruginosa]|nr:hypothetical protein CSC34_3600 [Pseudomonas aeruginosa]
MGVTGTVLFHRGSGSCHDSPRCSLSLNGVSTRAGQDHRAYPSQYMWSMKRFKNRPDGEKKWY